MPNKTIGIVGLDYCGSTLLNYVWDGLPGVFGAGETHWVVDEPETNCRQCNRPGCIVWKPEIRVYSQQNVDNGTWWETLREMAKADLIISSDKKAQHYEAFGVPDRLIFSYKDPRAHIFSRAAVRMGKSDAAVDIEIPDNVLDEAITWWVDETTQVLEWLMQGASEFKVIKLEEFVDDPEGQLQDFCNWAGVKYDKTALQFWRKRHHYIGGNHALSRLKRSYYFFRKIRKDERWKDSFTDEQVKRIADAEDVQIVEKQLVQLLKEHTLKKLA